MKRIAFLLIASSFLLSACMNPIPADFKGTQTSGFTEDDILIKWRLSKLINEKESLSPTLEDSRKTATYVVPLFDQLIPMIFADWKTGKLKVYKQVEMGQPLAEERTFKKLDQIYKEWGYADGLIMSDFQNDLHVNMLRSKHQIGFESRMLNLTINLHQIPKQKMPIIEFGYIQMADLEKLDYRINLNNKDIPLAEYLATYCAFKAIPIEHFSEKSTMGYGCGVRTLEEADFIKDKLLAGSWESISWLNAHPEWVEQLNTTDHNPIALTTAELEKFKGTYYVGHQPDQDSVVMKISTFEHGKVLQLEIPNKGYSETFWPSSKTDFFTRLGDEMVFYPDGTLSWKAGSPFDFPPTTGKKLN